VGAILGHHMKGIHGVDVAVCAGKCRGNGGGPSFPLGWALYAVTLAPWVPGVGG